MSNPKPKKINILFVCTGNTCRSAMAEQILKSFFKGNRILSRYNVKSAGLSAQTDSTMPQNALDALLQLNIKPSAHKPRQITKQIAGKSDLIICMTSAHKDAVIALTQAPAITLNEIVGGGDVQDPYGGGIREYLSVAECLSCACKDILKHIKALNLKC